jgi:hypothetical protein
MPTRRDLLLTAAVAAGGTAALAKVNVNAQASPDTSPEAQSSLSDLGYPELRITRTTDGYEVPRETPTGRVNLIVDDPDGLGGAVSIVKPAEGDTGDDLAYQGTPVSGNNTGGTPALDNAIWAGGEYFDPGGPTGGTILSLTSGEWFALDLMNPGAAPVGFTASGLDEPDYEPIPGIAAAIEMMDFQFRLPDRFEPGTQVWHVWNSGEQVHDIHILSAPEGTTGQEILDALYPPAGATPEAGGIDPNTDIVPQFGIATISSGQEIFKEVTLEVGTYAMTTWASDKHSGQPQLALGMISVFTVAAPGESAPPPSSPVPVEVHG